MASMNMMEQLEEEQKPRIDNPEGTGYEAALPKSTERNVEEPENLAMDLLCCRHSRPLPLELNCEIFKCLDLLIQRDFIWGLGRGIYEMFGPKLPIKLVKSKRLRNPSGNRWFGRNRANFVISEDGLNISARNTPRARTVSAEHGFEISRKYSRLDNYPGTILYYYEVSVLSFDYGFLIGLSSGNIPASEFIGFHQNSYCIQPGFAAHCYLAAANHNLQLPEAAIRPERNEYGNVYVCGLVLDPENKLWIFHAEWQTNSWANKFQSIRRFPFSSQLFASGNFMLRLTLAMIRQNLSNTTSKIFPDWDWNALKKKGKQILAL